MSETLTDITESDVPTHFAMASLKSRTKRFDSIAPSGGASKSESRARNEKRREKVELMNKLSTCVAQSAARGEDAPFNTKGYSSTYLAMGFVNVRAGARYPPEH